jgi:hypothetical protein
MMHLGFVDVPKIPLYPQEDKYTSINKMEKAKKVEALKDPQLTPSKITNGYDSVAHAMWLWTQVGTKTRNDIHIDNTQVADNFYKHVLGPAMKKAGVQPMSPELWRKKAYDNDTLDYKIEDAYGNDWINSVKHGWNTALVGAASDTSHMVSMVGGAFDNVVAQYKKEAAWRAQSDTVRAVELRYPNADPVAAARIRGDSGASALNWMQRTKEIDSQLAAKNADRGNGLVQRGAVYQEAQHQFWADAMPTHSGALNKATSFVVEQAGTVPAFAAIELGGISFEAVGAGTGFTAKLSETPAGRRMIGYLTAGAEGTAYGILTKPQDNPAQHLRDGLDFMVFHGLFDVAGMGTRKLIDMIPTDSKRFEAMKRRQDAVVLSWEKNQRLATPVEKYDAHVGRASNAITAVGMTGLRSMSVDGLAHLQKTEGMSVEERAAYEKKLMTEHPDGAARWVGPIATANFVRDLIGDKKLSDLTPEEEKTIDSRLTKLSLDAAGKINTKVNLKPEFEVKAETNLKQPSAKHTLDYYVKQIRADLAKDPGAAALLSPEQIQKAAQKKYAADLEKAAQEAEAQTGTPKIVKAQEVGKRIKTPPAMKTRTERTVSKGSVTVRYDKSPDFNVYMSDARKQAKSSGKSLTDFFKDMDERDFMEDVAQHFYPDSLRTAGVWFEGVGKYGADRKLVQAASKQPFSGASNPNFLAFMHNYAKQMPKEFAEALKEHLINTTKVQKNMNGRRLTDPQITYFAKSMYNHVDNFLGSGRWPKESNIFKSSQKNMWDSTEWQRDLLMEKVIQEQKNLLSAFSGDKKSQAIALATHAKFSGLRLKAFDLGASDLISVDAVRYFDDKIEDLQTKTGEFERWNF